MHSIRTRLGYRVRRPVVRGTATAITTATLVLAGCAGDDGSGDLGSGPGAPGAPGPAPSGPAFQLTSSLKTFESCDELRDWTSEELAPRLSSYYGQGYGGNVGRATPDMPAGTEEAEAGAGAEATTDEMTTSGGEVATPESSSADSSASAEGSAAPQAPTDASRSADGSADGGGSGDPSYSETNVQVAGIDEADVVKTDGERILAIAQGRLHLLDASSGQHQDSVELPGGSSYTNAEMVISENRALVFSSSADVIAMEPGVVVPEAGAAVEPSVAEPRVADGDERTAYSDGTTGLHVLEVELGESSLEIRDRFRLDGSYISARLTDGVARLVVHANPELELPLVTPANASPEAEEQAANTNQQVIEDADAEAFLPRWEQLDGSDGVVDEGSLVTCEGAHAPETFSGFGMVSVVSIDLSEGLADGVTSSNGAGVMAGGQTVYASHENLYVAAPKWVDWSTLSDEELAEAEQDYGTNIHVFDITDPEQAHYRMSGHVDGNLLNQFALDEHEGRLRVATTTGDPWAEGDGESESHVVILEPGDGGLVEVGSVSGLGQGESIYAVRFMGDVGYVVTFEQTDPLYTLDLSDPASPEEVGELEMLGYSAYLHPVGEGLLLGVGQDATEGGQTLGTQVSLFDVSDPEAPTRVAYATADNTWSTVESDHRAFLWWADTGLVALPAQTDQAPYEQMIGFRVDLDARTIEELGRVEHPGDQLEQPDPVPMPEPTPGPVPPNDDVAVDDVGIVEPQPVYDWAPAITRAFVIEDRLWTLSDRGLASSDLTTLEDTQFTPFP